MASALTPLGQRTKAGFQAKWGAQVGARKFQEALDKGLIDRGKMENVMMADDTGDEGAGDEMESMMQATPGNPSGGGQPLPKGNVGRGAKGAFQKRPG